MIYPMNHKQGRIREFLRDLAVAVLLLAVCYILGIVAWAAQAKAATGTVVAEVVTPVIVSDRGCLIGDLIVDCETLEPAGGREDDE